MIEFYYHIVLNVIINIEKKLTRDGFLYPSKNGFLRDKKYLQHPCPLNDDF